MTNETPEKTVKRVCVVGGGAAGMFAAGLMAGQGAEVVIYEHSEKTGLKLGITGKGRCNLTNNCSAEEYLKNVPTNPKFLYAAAAAFPPEETMKAFEAMGVPLKTERGKRVFPVSDRANDVVCALRRYCAGAKIIHRPVTGLIFDENYKPEDGKAPQKRVCGVRSDGTGDAGYDAVLICTGGMSYPSTGSRGGGYELARQAGHTVIAPRPSLVPLEAGGFCAALTGLSLKNSAVKVWDTVKKKVIYQDLGEMMFAHFGVTGPMILSASAYMKDMAPGRYEIEIDLKPGLDHAELDRRILSDFDKYKNKDFINSLDDLLPQSIIPVIVETSGIDGRKKVNEITREEREKLIGTIKGLKVKINGFRPIEEAIVTSGGVSVREISPKTMESKKAKGLYFAGEVIDVDAYTGGFNLQTAFATAYMAAQGIMSS